MAEALKKVGLVTEKQVIEIRKEKKEQPPPIPPSPPPKARTDTSRFSQMYNDERKHNFIMHLIYAYTPFVKGKFVFDWDTESRNPQNNNCCICNRQVMSKIDSVAIHNQYMDELMEKPEVNGFDILGATGKQVFGDKLLAVGSAESNSIFCAKCFEEFTLWITEELRHNNRKIGRACIKGTEFEGFLDKR